MKTVLYWDRANVAHNAILVPWDEVTAILGRPHDGSAEDDDAIIDALPDLPPWAADAEGWTEAAGWGLIGPELAIVMEAEDTARQIGTALAGQGRGPWAQARAFLSAFSDWGHAVSMLGHEAALAAAAAGFQEETDAPCIICGAPGCRSRCI